MLLDARRLERIHFVGVSGIGVSAAARIALEMGATVSGSADTENDQTRELGSLGMVFRLGHRAENVRGADAVVASAAVPACNPEIVEAERRAIPVYLYSRFVGMLMGLKKGIAVAGTHGKTTTTALIATILSRAGLDPTVVCGGVMRGFGTNALFGGGDHFVSEACEYNRSFLDLRKRHAVVTNVEPDHLDYYGSLEEIEEAFRLFLKTTEPGGFAVVNGDDGGVRDVLAGLEGPAVITVGEGASNDYRIAELRGTGGRYSCTLKRGLRTVLSLRVPVAGRHNCGNAALASVLALLLGVERRAIEDGVSTFEGTERRLEHLGRVGRSELYTDYGHHPTEIRSTLGALREMHPDEGVCLVFQPHQHSRTIELFDDFVKTLSGADLLVLTEIYRQRDSETHVGRVTGKDLFDAVSREAPNARFVPDRADIPRVLGTLADSCGVIVFMGAGDIDETARTYAETGIKGAR
jgi:UDP-N-acetylmuramate--alanine ligase